MRDILFRAKERFNGKWLYGNLIKYRNGEFAIQSMDKDHNVAVPVIADTIGQYTGLADSNLVVIFEGDILKLTDTKSKLKWYAKVEFGNPYSRYSWGYEFVYLRGDKVNTDCLLWVDMEECGAYCEVIGNIYDNPELLKEQEQ